MSVQFLGIASGTDWNSYIDSMVQLRSGPMEKLIEQRERLEFNRSVTNTVNQRLLQFDTTLSNLRFESTFLSRTVESSDSGYVSAVAEAGAALGAYNVIVNRLARASRASSGLDGQVFSKVADLSQSQTIGINSLVPYGDFQSVRASASTLIADTQQAGQFGAAITAGDTITITGQLKDTTAVSGTFTFAGDETDTLERLATTIAQVFQGEIGGSVGSNGELVFIETDPSVAGDVTFNTTIPPLDLQFNDADYSGSTLTFGIGNNVAGAGATARRLVHTVAFTTSGSLELNDTTDLATLDQVTGTLDSGDIIRIAGYETNGSSIAPVDFTYTGAAGGQTIADLITSISGAFSSATASYQNGRIVLTADATGPSSLAVSLEFIDQGSATDFELDDFAVAETGRTASSQMITTGSFTVEGTGEHLLSTTDGKAGKIRGNLTLPDPSNTLGSFGVTEFDMLAIDPDGTAGPLGPVTITGLSEYSTLQDLVDVINEQVPTVTAQLDFNGTSYFFELMGNRGGQDIRVYDDASGILQILGAGNPTDIDTAVPDTYATSATTDSDDVTFVAWFRPDSGGPLQRTVWTGDEGGSIDTLIGGVAIVGLGGAFNAGTATVVTANSSELNTEQETYSYQFGSNAIVTDPPAHFPPLDPSLSLAEAGFATTPENAADNPLFHTDGFFTINGVRVNVGDVNTMTVNELLGAINTSGAGVSAYFDAANGRFYLRSNDTGPQNITLGGGGDTSNFLTIAGLTTDSGAVFSAGQQKGSIDTDLPLAQSGFNQTVTSGVFTINNTKITVDAGVDTLEDLISKINNSGAGVIASYDPVSDSIALQQDLDQNPTAYRISIGDAADTSNFLEAAQLTLDTTVPTQIGTTRQTAAFSVNGVSYTRSSNSVDDVVDKLTLSLNAVTTGPVTLTVSADTERIEGAIIDFVVDYNQTLELINGQPLSKEERKYTAELTDEDADQMTLDEIEEYLVRREELMVRDFVSRDSTIRNMSRRIISLVQGPISNGGTFGSLSQIGLATSEIGGGPEVAAISLGRLLYPTSDRETITELVQSSSELQDAIRNSSDDLYELFAGLPESYFTHQGSRDLSGGITVSDSLSFTIGNGSATASVTFNPGTYTQTTVLNAINQQLSSSGLSSSILAYFDASSQLSMRVTELDGQARLQLQDLSTGGDSLLGILGLQPGVFLGPDPSLTSGVARRTRSYVQSITSSGGILMERLKQGGSFDRQIGTYDDAIQRQEDYLLEYQTRLRNQFARLETQLATLQSQSQAIEQALTQLNAATGNNQ